MVALVREPTPQFRFAEHVLDLDLTAYLVDAREQGVSFERIARTLRETTDGVVAVTAETVRNWCVRAGIDTKPKAKAS